MTRGHPNVVDLDVVANLDVAFIVEVVDWEPRLFSHFFCLHVSRLPFRIHLDELPCVKR